LVIQSYKSESGSHWTLFKIDLPDNCKNALTTAGILNTRQRFIFPDTVGTKERVSNILSMLDISVVWEQTASVSDVWNYYQSQYLALEDTDSDN
jgi:hypothetical protein